MIELSHNVFIILTKLLAQPPLTDLGDTKLPEGVKSFGTMPEDLKAAYSAIVRLGAESVELARRIADLEQNLPPLDENLARTIRRLSAPGVENQFDRLIEMDKQDKRLSMLIGKLMELFYAELRDRFPKQHINYLGVTADWELFIRT